MSWYRRLQELPLRTKLLVTLLGAGLLLLGGASIASFRYWHQEALAAAENQARLAAESTRSAVEGALTAGRPVQARRSLRNLVEGGPVRSARVFDASGRVVLSSDRSEEGRNLRSVWVPSAGELPGEGVVRRAADEESVRAFLPIRVAGGDVFEVELALDPLVGAAEQGVWLGVGLLLASAIALVAIVWIMIQREVVDPLRRVDDLLERASGRAEAGRGRGEVGRIEAGVESLIEKEEAAERTLEEQRRRLAQREGLAEVGELAAEMAHELKRPLANVRTAMELLEQEYRLDDKGDRLVEQVESQLDQLGETMGDLFSLARPVELEGERVEPGGLVDEALAGLSGHPALEGIRIRRDREEGLPTLEGDRRRLAQAIQNLVVNAGEAMEGEGEIAVRIHRGSENGVVIEVEDTGPGMAPEMVEEVVRPFYSTKPRGTGLGLALVQRVATAHGGALELESEPGEGTAARLHLPAAARMAAGGAR